MLFWRKNRSGQRDALLPSQEFLALHFMVLLKPWWLQPGDWAETNRALTALICLSSLAQRGGHLGLHSLSCTTSYWNCIRRSIAAHLYTTDLKGQWFHTKHAGTKACPYSTCLIPAFHTGINICLPRDSHQQNIYSYSNFSRKEFLVFLFLHTSFILVYCLSTFLPTAIQKSFQLTQTIKILRQCHNRNTNRNGFINSSGAVWEWLLLCVTKSPEMFITTLRIK